MGSTGKSDNNQRETFDYVTFANDHTKKQIVDELKKRAGIDVAEQLQNQLKKEALAYLCKYVDEISVDYEKEFGFSPIYEVNSSPNLGGYASANWYSGINDNETFSISVSATDFNNDYTTFFPREAVAHEFGHLVAAYLAYHTSPTVASALEKLRSTQYSTDRSEYDSRYDGWNTQFAKDIMINALKNSKFSEVAARYNAALEVGQSYIGEGDYSLINKFAKTEAQAKKALEQFAINRCMKHGVSEYATSSYHEAIAECFAREYIGQGTNITKAVTNEVKKQFAEMRKTHPAKKK